MATSNVPYAIVFDDDRLILMRACDMLEEAGFRFHEAGTGEDAKAVLADHADDVTLLLSDVETPGDTDRLLSPITLPSICPGSRS